MQTEWHNYKSAKTGRIVGSYGYLPDTSDNNLVHVYEAGGRFNVYHYIKALMPLSGPVIGAQTLAQAKTAAMRPIIAHVRGQGSLQLTPYI